MNLGELIQLKTYGNEMRCIISAKNSSRKKMHLIRHLTGMGFAKTVILRTEEKKHLILDGAANMVDDNQLLQVVRTQFSLRAGHFLYRRHALENTRSITYNLQILKISFTT